MASAKTLRKLFALFLSAIMVLSLTACAGNTETTPSDSGNSVPSSEQSSSGGFEVSGENKSKETESNTSSNSKILVAYFHTTEKITMSASLKKATPISLRI